MRRHLLRTLREKLEAALAATAFAEENDVDTARELLARAADPARGPPPPGSDAW